MCDRSYEPSRQLFQEETLSVTDSIAHFAGISNTCLSGVMASYRTTLGFTVLYVDCARWRNRNWVERRATLWLVMFNPTYGIVAKKRARRPGIPIVVLSRSLFMSLDPLRNTPEQDCP